MKIRELSAWMFLVLALLALTRAVTRNPEYVDKPCPDSYQVKTEITSPPVSGKKTVPAVAVVPPAKEIKPLQDQTNTRGGYPPTVPPDSTAIYTGSLEDSTIKIDVQAFIKNHAVDSFSISYYVRPALTVSTTTITAPASNTPVKNKPASGLYITGELTPTATGGTLALGAMRTGGVFAYGASFDYKLQQIRILAALKIK